MVTDAGAKPEGQTHEKPDATADLLSNPVVAEALAARERDTETRVETHWRSQLERATKELGLKQNNWGKERTSLQEKLDEAEAKVAAAALGDDANAIARSRVQLARLQHDAEAKDQELATRNLDLALREILLGIREQYPGLPAKFWEDAKRRLSPGPDGQPGVPSYVIEREARSQTPGNGTTRKPKAEGAGMPAEMLGGSGEQVTKDNIDKLHLEGKVPDDRYRTFLQTGQL